MCVCVGVGVDLHTSRDARIPGYTQEYTGKQTKYERRVDADESDLRLQVNAI